MAESDRQVLSRRDPIAAIIFYVACALSLPAILVGYVLWVGKLYFTTEVLESPALHLRLLRAMLRAGSEPLKFGIDSAPPSSERLAEWLPSCGLSLRAQRTLGKETDGKRALGGFAIAAVNSDPTTVASVALSRVTGTAPM